MSDDDLLIERLLEANNYLRAENTALRNTLGLIQGCPPEEVEFDFDYDTELENLVEATTFAPAMPAVAPPAPGTTQDVFVLHTTWDVDTPGLHICVHDVHTCVYAMFALTVIIINIIDINIIIT